jgi:hypothetical protein
MVGDAASGITTCKERVLDSFLRIGALYRRRAHLLSLLSTAMQVGNVAEVLVSSQRLLAAGMYSDLLLCVDTALLDLSGDLSGGAVTALKPAPQRMSAVKKSLLLLGHTSI